MAKKNLFENIFAPIGGAIQGTARGLFPGWAGALDRQAQAQLANIELARQKQGLEQEKFGLAEEQFGLLQKTSKKGQKNTRLSQLMEIIKDPRPVQYGGFSPEDKKAAGDEIRQMLLKRVPQGQITGGWQGTPQAEPQGGAFGRMNMPQGMVPEKVETDKGYPVVTYGQEFAKPSGAYQYIPEADRPEVARKQLEKAGVQVDIGLGEAQKATIGKLEDQILELDKMQVQLEDVSNSYRPEFSTWGFRGKKWLSTKFEKAGVKPPEKESLLRTSKQQTRDYISWYQPAEAAFLSFRRWATGVAGGEREMSQMREAFPEPRNLSPTEFRAAIDKAQQFRNAYRKRLEDYRLRGSIIDKKTQSQIAMEALSEVTSEGRIQVIGPDGQEGTMDASELKDYPEWRRKE